MATWRVALTWVRVLMAWRCAQDLGMSKIGDRLYFMEVLTQLHDAVNSWSKMLGQSLSSTRTLPNLQRNGLPLQVRVRARVRVRPLP